MYILHPFRLEIDRRSSKAANLNNNVNSICTVGNSDKNSIQQSKQSHKKLNDAVIIVNKSQTYRLAECLPNIP